MGRTSGGLAALVTLLVLFVRVVDGSPSDYSLIGAVVGNGDNVAQPTAATLEACKAACGAVGPTCVGIEWDTSVTNGCKTYTAIGQTAKTVNKETLIRNEVNITGGGGYLYVGNGYWGGNGPSLQGTGYTLQTCSTTCADAVDCTAWNLNYGGGQGQCFIYTSLPVGAAFTSDKTAGNSAFRQVATRSPTWAPSGAPTTAVPTAVPTQVPTTTPSVAPTQAPVTKAPTNAGQTYVPTSVPTTAPTQLPTSAPVTTVPTSAPTSVPTMHPSGAPTQVPTTAPTQMPSIAPTLAPVTGAPTPPGATYVPSSAPTVVITALPTGAPTTAPTHVPTSTPSITPTRAPVTGAPTLPGETYVPTSGPTSMPTAQPTTVPTTAVPTSAPTFASAAWLSAAATSFASLGFNTTGNRSAALLASFTASALLVEIIAVRGPHVPGIDPPNGRLFATLDIEGCSAATVDTAAGRAAVERGIAVAMNVGRYHVLVVDVSPAVGSTTRRRQLLAPNDAAVVSFNVTYAPWGTAMDAQELTEEEFKNIVLAGGPIVGILLVLQCGGLVAVVVVLLLQCKRNRELAGAGSEVGPATAPLSPRPSAPPTPRSSAFRADNAGDNVELSNMGPLPTPRNSALRAEGPSPLDVVGIGSRPSSPVAGDRYAQPSRRVSDAEDLPGSIRARRELQPLSALATADPEEEGNGAAVADANDTTASLALGELTRAARSGATDEEIAQRVRALYGGGGGAAFAGLMSPTSYAVPLPAHWMEITDTESGHSYFHNGQTGESQWERPVAPTEPMSPAPMSPAPLSAIGASLNSFASQLSVRFSPDADSSPSAADSSSTPTPRTPRRRTSIGDHIRRVSTQLRRVSGVGTGGGGGLNDDNDIASAAAAAVAQVAAEGRGSMYDRDDADTSYSPAPERPSASSGLGGRLRRLSLGLRGGDGSTPSPSERVPRISIRGRLRRLSSAIRLPAAVASPETAVAAEHGIESFGGGGGAGGASRGATGLLGRMKERRNSMRQRRASQKAATQDPDDTFAVFTAAMGELAPVAAPTPPEEQLGKVSYI